jgi:hypothetical protein
MQRGKCGSCVHILILFYWLCIWLGHWGGHGHRSSSVRRRLQSQDVDCLDNTGANKRMIEGVFWGGGLSQESSGGLRRRGGGREQVAGARLDFSYALKVMMIVSGKQIWERTGVTGERAFFLGGASSAEVVAARPDSRTPTLPIHQVNLQNAEALVTALRRSDQCYWVNDN